MYESLGNEENQESSIEMSIPNSCHIKCVDSIYQAMFHHLAAMESPIVFNNTCWSWSDVADSFIGNGAKGYIGTLWNIDNEIARGSAEVFYGKVFQKPILFALHEAMKISKKTRDEDIYIYWGLHFTRLVPSIKLEASRLMTFRQLITSMEIWKRKLQKTKISKHKKTIDGIIDWLSHKLARDFKEEVIKYLYKK